ncbi:MAG: hypothetical protein K6C98_08220 [Treponema sp.]|nr:hypothetical protein [Treponema sp.]
MTFKANPEKKKEFKNFMFKKILLRFLPILLLGLVFLDVSMGYVFWDETKNIKLIIFSTLISNVIFLVLCLFAFHLGTKMAASSLESWELNIEENYAILNNSAATSTVRFADFKKFKKTSDSITFYLGGLKQFYIYWDAYYDSDKLKNCLEDISQKIGAFTKENIPEDTPKTKVKFKSKFNIFLYVIIAIMLLIKILKIL